MQPMRFSTAVRGSVLLAGAVLVMAAPRAQAQVDQPRVLDDFSTVVGWTAHPSDGTVLTIRSDSGVRGNAMRLDFDFRGGGGYVIARKEIPISFPANYDVSFRIRGDAPRNNLEIKFVDPSGDNVWWVNRRDFAFQPRWTEVVLRKRHITFAWGPLGGGELKESAAIEFAITAGNGGSGTVWIDELRLTPRAPVVAYTGTPVVRASIESAGGAAGRALDGRQETSWRSRPEGAPPRAGTDLATLSVDFRQARELGGLTIHWGPADFATSYQVDLSNNGANWRTAYEVRNGNGGVDHIALPETETRYVRLRFVRSSRGRGYHVADVDVQPLAWSASTNEFFATIAKDSPRGDYPKYLSGVQSYWTVIGVSGDPREAMINEEGTIETGKGEFSLEPFLFADGRLITWADAAPTQSLERGDLPVPSVRWASTPVSLTVTAFANGAPGASILHARYRVENRSTTRQATTLFVALRPFQVNPSWQFLNTTGGVARVEKLRATDGGIMVNNVRTVIPVTAPTAFGAATFDQGNVVEFLRRGRLPSDSAVTDNFGYASGALSWALDLPPGATQDVWVAVPLNDPTPPKAADTTTTAARRLEERIRRERTARPDSIVARRPVSPPRAQGNRGAPEQRDSSSLPPSHRAPTQASAYGDSVLAENVRTWSAELDKVGIALPANGERITRTIRSNLAWILINRDGPSIQPGSRSYERSWIRDGSLTSAAMLRLGHAREVREFIEWYAPYQFANGKVPCCVDHRGADPVPEHDSHGQLIYLITEYHRFTRDTAFLARMWPHIARAVGYIDTLRAQRMTPEYQTGDKRAYYGLVPQSISHEGYSAKPMHSFWDDLFVLRGFKDAAESARILGKADTAAIFGRKRDEFRRNVMDAYRATMAMHHIDYLAGAVELGDFDATSTTVGIAPGGEITTLPQPALDRTFQKSLETFRGRREETVASEAYTPYELRVVGSFVRLGQKAVAHELLDFFFRDQRPPAWNHWAEVVWKDPTAPKFIGDMPHTWVGSDYIRSATDMFVYEREHDDALIVGAGILEEWVTTSPGIAVRNLATHYGPLRYTVTGSPTEARYRIDAGVRVPTGGIVVMSPFTRAPIRATVNGQPGSVRNGAVTIRSLPAEIIFAY